MNQQEWDALCDGCGYCCLVKLEDEDDNAVYTTNVACRYLDLEKCSCTDYQNRIKNVASCLVINLENPELFKILPETCAYRLLYEGKPLYDWHPLNSGKQVTVWEAGVSVCGYAVSEEHIHQEQLEDHIIHQIK